MLKKIASFFKGTVSIADALDRVKTATQSEINTFIKGLPKPAFDMVNSAVKAREVTGE